MNSFTEFYGAIQKANHKNESYTQVYEGPVSNVTVIQGRQGKYHSANDGEIYYAKAILPLLSSGELLPFLFSCCIKT